MGRPAGRPTTAQAYSALTETLSATEPSCSGDDRFTDDTADPQPLVAICRQCPLIEPCRDLALASYAGPVFGIVGGLVRRTSGKRDTLGRIA